MALGKKDVVEELKRGGIVVEPLSGQHLQTAGLQLSLGRRLAKMKVPQGPWWAKYLPWENAKKYQTIDPALKTTPEWESFDIDPEHGYVLKPGEFVLGHTYEKLGIGRHLLAMIDGRSTMGRCGITPHQTAMAIWPGHGMGPSGARSITLEIKNGGDCAVVLRERLFVANMTFHRLDTPVEAPYDQLESAKYSADTGVLLPKFNGEFLEEELILTGADELPDF